MNISFDPRLVEEAVDMIARRDTDKWESYRRRLNPLYDGRGKQDGESAWDEVLLRLFRRWAPVDWCENALKGLLGVDRALVARSRGRGDEGADLLVRETRTVLLRLAPERFLEPEALRVLVSHELRHVSDMLDPTFGYEPDLGVRGRTRPETELIRGRYRVLWNLLIDALEVPTVPAETRLQELQRAFAALDESQCTQLAARFSKPEAHTHADLSEAARDPWSYLGVTRRKGPTPGQPCPLCAFPTFDWADDAPAEAVRRDFPNWDPDQGTCGQCRDIYRNQAQVR